MEPEEVWFWEDGPPQEAVQMTRRQRFEGIRKVWGRVEVMEDVLEKRSRLML